MEAGRCRGGDRCGGERPLAGPELDSGNDDGLGAAHKGPGGAVVGAGACEDEGTKG